MARIALIALVWCFSLHLRGICFCIPGQSNRGLDQQIPQVMVVRPSSDVNMVAMAMTQNTGTIALSVMKPCMPEL